MKMIILEGSPEELADYQARTDVIGLAHVGANALEQTGDRLARGDEEAISDGEHAVAKFRPFIVGRAREPEVAARVEDYLRRVLDLGTWLKIGTSKSNRERPV